MTGIIKKTYIINLKHRTDRWANINNDFKDTVVMDNVCRWDAVYGKELTDDKIKSVTTYKGYHCCSPSMIGCWLSHYTLWKHIVDNKETDVLVLEDDAYPVYKGSEFNNKLAEFWQEVSLNFASDVDMIYFGCFGSCDNSVVQKNFFQLYGGKENKKISRHIVRPGFPLGAHAYMLSYKGAQKLIDSNKFNKVDYHIDHHLANYFASNTDFNVYAFYPALIRQYSDSNYSDNQISHYPLFSKLFSNLSISEQHTVESFCAIQVIQLRKLGITVSILSMSLIIISLLLGIVSTMLASYKIIIYYCGFLLIYYLAEIFYGYYQTSQTTHNKNLIVDCILSYLFLFIGRYIGSYFK